MSERQRGRDPNRRASPAEYRQAIRFPDESASNTAYEQTRQIIFEEDCDLSLYRAALLPDIVWHILVLGQTPKEQVRERINTSLAGGEAVELPEEVWQAFNQRRLEQSSKGTWVERRHLGGRKLR